MNKSYDERAKFRGCCASKQKVVIIIKVINKFRYGELRSVGDRKSMNHKTKLVESLLKILPSSVLLLKQRSKNNNTTNYV